MAFIFMKKTIAIIAEYNPMHNGHVHQIQMARQQFSDCHLIVILSPNFTQRGVPAVLDKYTRTGIALENDVDLVLQLPVIGATSSAETFARTGVSILHSIGIVTDIVFGAETPGKEKLLKLAGFLLDEPEEYKATLSFHLKTGLHFARARFKAIETVLGKEYSDILATPNNILAIEYIKALLYFRSPIDFTPLKRESGFASSTSIRFILSNDSKEALDLPENSHLEILQALEKNELIFTDDFSQALHTRLLQTGDFSYIADCTKELLGRSEKLKEEFISFSDFADRLNTKNYTYTHVMRYLLHLLLMISKHDQNDLTSLSYAPYAYVLGIKKESSHLLSSLKEYSRIPVLTSAKEADKLLSSQAADLYSLDVYADQLYRIVKTSKSGISYPNEYRQKFITL